MTAGRRFFFIHVMKTAGGTLRRHIRANFAEDEVYPLQRLDGNLLHANFMLSHLAGLPPERRQRIRAYTGHFPFMAVDVLGEDLTTITVLRHPVERTLSYLRNHRLYERGKGVPMEELYEDPYWFPFFIHNHQAKLFALTVEDEPDSYMHPLEVDRERLELAKANLGRVDVLGTQEGFGDVLTELRDRFGWHIGDVADVHVNPGREVPASFRRRIEEDNAADMEFYEHALALCAERRRTSTRA